MKRLIIIYLLACCFLGLSDNGNKQFLQTSELYKTSGHVQPFAREFARVKKENIEGFACGCIGYCGCEWQTVKEVTLEVGASGGKSCLAKLRAGCNASVRSCAGQEKGLDWAELYGPIQYYRISGTDAQCGPGGPQLQLPVPIQKAPPPKPVPQPPSSMSIGPYPSVGLEPTARRKMDFGAICEILKGKSWAEIISGSTSFAAELKGRDSGILNDSGSRFFYEKVIPDCGGGSYGITLRYTQDRVLDKAVYEVFVKSHLNSEVIGLAFNNEGKEIDVVPLNIASDKNHHYGGKAQDRSITSRKGCFRCHGNTEDAVSFVYNVPGAKEFWSQAKLVEFLKAEPAASNPRR